MTDKSNETNMNTPAEKNVGDNPQTVSFTRRMLASESFILLFREGMGLVEETANYLDGDGRVQARNLDRNIALTYASESMRLTTRLMQMTSWLLLQRAVNEGELSREDAEREHRRITIATHEASVNSDTFQLLPEKLQNLVERSKSLAQRIHRIDADIRGEMHEQTPNFVAGQINQLAAAFKRG